MIRLRPPSALKLVVLPFAVGTLQHFDVHLERFFAHVFAPDQELDGFAVVCDGDGADGLVPLRVDFGG